MKCATHSDIETSLTCGKCGTPICPRCLVQTPVGMRCKDCARLKRIPTYQVPATYYLRAVGAGLVVAVVCGVIWWAINGILPFFLLRFLIAAGAGYAIGEGISFSVNRKRGTGLAVVGGFAVALTFTIAAVIMPVLVGSGIGSVLFGLIAMVIAIVVAVMRLR